MKRAFIIHGWDGYPEEGWFPWLKSELEKNGFVVSVPAMPHPDEPTIGDWVRQVTQSVGAPDADTFLIGHSIGANTVLRYLETIATPIGGAVCIAGALVLSEKETEEDTAIGKPWMETPIDFEKVKQNCPALTAIFSKDEDVIPLEANRDIFKQKLRAHIIMEPSGGHFSGSDGVTELPRALQAVLDMTLGG